MGVGGKSSDPLATAIARIEERLRKWPILIDAFRRLAEARAAHEGRWPWPWSLEVMADDLNRCPNLGFALDVLDAALTAGRGGAPVKRLSGCIRTQSHIVARAMIPKREAEWAEMKEQERRMFPRKPDPQAAMDAVYAWGDDE